MKNQYLEGKKQRNLNKTNIGNLKSNETYEKPISGGQKTTKP
jgi:hypothetical protein